MYHLTFMTGPRKGRRVAVTGHALVMGRHPDCQLVLSDEENAADQQAVIEPGVEGCILTDLGGTLPTLVNGNAVRGSIPLKNRDQIEIGRTLLQFAMAGGASVAGARRRAGVLQPAAMSAMVMFLAGQFVFLADLERLMEAPLPNRPTIGQKPDALAKAATSPAPATHRVDVPTGAAAKMEAQTPPASHAPVAPTNTARLGDAAVMLQRAQMLKAQGRFEAAHKQLALIQETVPEYLPAYNERAQLFETQGRLDDAISELRHAFLRAADPGKETWLIQRLDELQSRRRGSAPAPNQPRLR